MCIGERNHRQVVKFLVMGTYILYEMNELHFKFLEKYTFLWKNLNQYVKIYSLSRTCLLVCLFFK